MERISLVMVELEVTLKPLLPLAVYETTRRLDSKFSSLAARIFDFILRRCAQFGFDPPNQLVQSHLEGPYPSLLASLAKLDLLILDDWMRVPITASNAQDLLELLDDRFGRVSMIVVSQVPVADWYARFPDPTLGVAILDRIIHNAYRLTLTGDS